MQYYAVCMQKLVMQLTSRMNVLITIALEIKVLFMEEIYGESRCQVAVSFDIIFITGGMYALAALLTRAGMAGYVGSNPPDPRS